MKIQTKVGKASPKTPSQAKKAGMEPMAKVSKLVEKGKAKAGKTTVKPKQEVVKKVEKKPEKAAKEPLKIAVKTPQKKEENTGKLSKKSVIQGVAKKTDDKLTKSVSQGVVNNPPLNMKNEIENKTNKKMEKKVEKKRKSGTSSGPVDLPPLEQQKGEEYMNKRQLDYFQEILSTWRDQLHAERNATVQHMQEDPINFPDLLDRAALEEEHKLEWQAREREHKLIIKIEKALANIKQGDYGYCEKCGAEIGLMRLQVRPTATLCVDCKSIDEIRERQTGVIE